MTQHVTCSRQRPPPPPRRRPRANETSSRGGRISSCPPSMRSHMVKTPPLHRTPLPSPNQSLYHFLVLGATTRAALCLTCRPIPPLFSSSAGTGRLVRSHRPVGGSVAGRLALSPRPKDVRAALHNMDRTDDLRPAYSTSPSNTEANAVLTGSRIQTTRNLRRPLAPEHSLRERCHFSGGRQRQELHLWLRTDSGGQVRRLPEREGWVQDLSGCTCLENRLLTSSVCGQRPTSRVFSA